MRELQARRGTEPGNGACESSCETGVSDGRSVPWARKFTRRPDDLDCATLYSALVSEGTCLNFRKWKQSRADCGRCCRGDVSSGCGWAKRILLMIPRRSSA